MYDRSVWKYAGQVDGVLLSIKEYAEDVAHTGETCPTSAALCQLWKATAPEPQGKSVREDVTEGPDSANSVRSMRRERTPVMMFSFSSSSIRIEGLCGAPPCPRIEYTVRDRPTTRGYPTKVVL